MKRLTSLAFETLTKVGPEMCLSVRSYTQSHTLRAHTLFVLLFTSCNSGSSTSSPNSALAELVENKVVFYGTNL